MVVLLVRRADAFEDFDGLIHRRLVHLHGLEAPLERRVGFDVFAIFVQRGRADHLQFAARERRLEDVGRVHRGTGRARAHQHVDFVNEQDRAGLFQLVNDAFESFFKLAAIHGAGHQRTHVQLEQALVHQRGWHVAVHDALGEAFHDGGLAHAGFADQRGIVLGAARQNLDDALDFHLPPDDRIQFLFLGPARQVGGELVHERGLLPGLAGTRGLGGPGRGRGGGGFVQDAAGLPADLVGRHAEAAQDFHRHAFHAHERQQDVFGADVVMAEAAGFVHGEFQHLLGVGGEVNFTAAKMSRRGNASDHFAHTRGFQSEFP